MKLLQILEGHWAVVPDYPNSIIKGKKEDKKERLSLFVDPKQRDKYIKKMKMGKKKNAKGTFSST